MSGSDVSDLLDLLPDWVRRRPIETDWKNDSSDVGTRVVLPLIENITRIQKRERETGWDHSKPIETSWEEKERDVGEALDLLLHLSSPCQWVPLGEERLQRLGRQGGDDGDGDDVDDGDAMYGAHYNL